MYEYKFENGSFPAHDYNVSEVNKAPRVNFSFTSVIQVSILSQFYVNANAFKIKIKPHTSRPNFILTVISLYIPYKCQQIHSWAH